MLGDGICIIGVVATLDAFALVWRDRDGFPPLPPGLLTDMEESLTSMRENASVTPAT